MVSKKLRRNISLIMITWTISLLVVGCGQSTSKINEEVSKTESIKQELDKNNKPNNNKPEQESERTWEYMSGLSEEAFNALNSYRQSNGVPPLSYSSREQSRIKSRAEYNAKTKTFGHDLDQISLGSGLGSGQAYINQWANSSAHKNSMLDEVNTRGAVSVYKDSEGNYYVVASFGYDW